MSDFRLKDPWLRNRTRRDVDRLPTHDKPSRQRCQAQQA
jgi:hypothetical protein